MKYQVKYIIDEKKTPKDKIRDLKLQMVEDNVDNIITSDYPIPVLANNSIVFIGTTKFIVTEVATEITTNCYAILLTIIDFETKSEIAKKEGNDLSKAQLNSMMQRIKDQNKQQTQKTQDIWSINKNLWKNI